MKFKLIINKDAEEEIVAIVHSQNELVDKIETLVLNYQGKDKIQVHNDDEIILLSFIDIECITIINRKVIVIDKKGVQYRTNKRLCELEEILPSYFIRINKSTLANQNQILRFVTVYTGAVDAVFKCGYKDYVSRRCLVEIKRRLGL